MRHRQLSIALLAIALFPTRAPGEDPPRTVSDNEFEWTDAAALKGGEWEMRESRDDSLGPGYPASISRQKTACVRTDSDYVWIEVARSHQIDGHPDEWTVEVVECFQVSRSDRKIVKAWRGKPGEEGRPVTVVAGVAGGVAAIPKVQKTGKVSREKLTVAGKEMSCEKVETQQPWKDEDGQSGVTTVTRWYSSEDPRCLFSRGRSKRNPTDGDDEIRWEGDKPTRKGREVLLTISNSDKGKLLIAFVGCGNDAKPTLVVK